MSALNMVNSITRQSALHITPAAFSKPEENEITHPLSHLRTSTTITAYKKHSEVNLYILHSPAPDVKAQLSALPTFTHRSAPARPYNASSAPLCSLSSRSLSEPAPMQNTLYF